MTGDVATTTLGGSFAGAFPFALRRVHARIGRDHQPDVGRDETFGIDLAEAPCLACCPTTCRWWFSSLWAASSPRRCWSAPFLLAYKSPDAEKLSAYECGFNPFDDARMKFDVRFYLVSLLFIIFDLEVAFLFPWAVAFHDVGAVRLLVDDAFPVRADDRLRLRMEQGSAGMGLSAGTLVAPAPRGVLDPATGKPVGANDPLFRRDQRPARRQGLSRHRPPTTSSSGRAPAR